MTSFVIPPHVADIESDDFTGFTLLIVEISENYELHSINFDMLDVYPPGVVVLPPKLVNSFKFIFQ